VQKREIKNNRSQALTAVVNEVHLANVVIKVQLL
jgi:hypothetical protein